MDHQDWKPVVLTKRPVNNKPSSKNRVPISGVNKNFNTRGTGKKVDADDDEIKKPPTVGLTIGKQIATARNLKKLTQTQLAAQMNITIQDVSNERKFRIFCESTNYKFTHRNIYL